MQEIAAAVVQSADSGQGIDVEAMKREIIAAMRAELQAVVDSDLKSVIKTAVAEAMALGSRLDLPMQDVVVALSSGAAGSWALSNRADGMLAGHYPLGFRLTLHHKDLGIALEAADSVQLTLPISNLVQQQEAELIARGHGDEDVSALHRLFDAES